MVLHELPLPVFLTRLLCAALFGILIGIERYFSHRPAGLHTEGLIATGAALFASIEPAATGQSSYRIIANIVTGIGFLAGGVILRQGTTVTGLNTAATMWATAAVGALAGIGLLREAAISAVSIVLINSMMMAGARAMRRRAEEDDV